MRLIWRGRKCRAGDRDEIWDGLGVSRSIGMLPGGYAVGSITEQPTAAKHPAEHGKATFPGTEWRGPSKAGWRHDHPAVSESSASESGSKAPLPESTAAEAGRCKHPAVSESSATEPGSKAPLPESTAAEAGRCKHPAVSESSATEPGPTTTDLGKTAAVSSSVSVAAKRPGLPAPVLLSQSRVYQPDWTSDLDSRGIHPVWVHSLPDTAAATSLRIPAAAAAGVRDGILPRICGGVRPAHGLYRERDRSAAMRAHRGGPEVSTFRLSQLRLRLEPVLIL